jgi:hypothetical protein
MPLLVAEVMDKVAESFQGALCVTQVTAPVGLAVGWLGPRAFAAMGLVLMAVVAGLFLVGDLNDPFANEIRQYARAEAGTIGVLQDIASVHLLWGGPLVGLLGGLALRGLQARVLTPRPGNSWPESDWSGDVDATPGA